MGSLRCWLFRGGVVALLGGLIAGAVVVSDTVSPERVRALLEAHLSEKLPGATVHVGSARLRLFGGITATDVTITRPGASEPFFVAPVVVLAHDKEQLHQGRLVLRKVELDGPRLEVVRRADGGWSLAELLPPGGDPEAAIPTVIVKNALVRLLDERAEPLPPILLSNAKFQLLNDPPPVVRVDGEFTVAPAVPDCPLSVAMSLSLKLDRATGAVQLQVEVPELPLTEQFTPAVAKVAPGLVDHLTPLTAQLGVRLDLRRGNRDAPWQADVKLEVRDGRYETPDLPWPVQHLAGVVHYKNGRVTVEKATARLGTARLELALESRPVGEAYAALAGDGDPIDRLEAGLESLTVRVQELELTDELFAVLPAQALGVRETFHPVGRVDFLGTLSRSPAGTRHEFEVVPNRLTILYEKFKYPVQELRGSVKRVQTPDGSKDYVIGLDGTASGRPVKLTGRVGVEGTNPLIDLKLLGMDFPIDEKLMAAMPAKYAKELTRLHPSGRADFTADIHQPQNVDRCETSVRVRVYSGSVNAEQFPYPLTGIAGQVLIRVSACGEPTLSYGARMDTDRVELRDFRATHGGGLVRFSLTDEPVPNSPDRRRVLDVSGENLPLDNDFRTSLGHLGGEQAWASLNPQGALTFAAHVEVADRAVPAVTPVAVLTESPGLARPGGQPPPPFNPAQDLSVVASFAGPTVTPRAFPYAFREVEGALRYAGGKLELSDLKAKNKSSRFQVSCMEVRFADAGGLWANLGRTTVRPLTLDDPELTAALPEGVRKCCRSLELHGPMELVCKQFVCELPGDDRASAGYWNAELKLHGASADAGVKWTEVVGSLASVGEFGPAGVGPAFGNAWFPKAKVAGQPLTDVKLTYRVRPSAPDASYPGGVTPVTVEFPDIAAGLFSGTLGGQARVEFVGGDPRFDLWLNAARVRVDQLARHWNPDTGAELAGLIQGELRLGNPPDAATGLATVAGTGRIDVPQGRLLNLPVLVPLLKLLKLQTPDQTAFEEAHAKFTVRGDRVMVNQLDLIGTALSLGGSGELDTAGEDVRFEFYTVWSQTLRRWLESPLGDLTGAISENLFRIDMTKKPGAAMAYTPHVLPAVTDPMRGVIERMRGRLAVLPVPEGTYRGVPAP